MMPIFQSQKNFQSSKKQYNATRDIATGAALPLRGILITSFVFRELRPRERATVASTALHVWNGSGRTSSSASEMQPWRF
jgi:hypothetical protein